MYKDINKNIIEINNILSTYKNIKFLDIYSLFLGEEEKIDNKFSSDGVHLSTYAYDILNKKIEEALQW
jgi:lysophospholipase L1-like esterase